MTSFRRRRGRPVADGAGGPGDVPRRAGLDGVLPERRGVDGACRRARRQHAGHLLHPHESASDRRHLRQRRDVQRRQGDGESLSGSTTDHSRFVLLLLSL